MPPSVSPSRMTKVCFAPRLCLRPSYVLWRGLFPSFSWGVCSASLVFLGYWSWCWGYLVVSVALGELTILLLFHVLSQLKYFSCFECSLSQFDRCNYFCLSLIGIRAIFLYTFPETQIKVWSAVQFTSLFSFLGIVVHLLSVSPVFIQCIVNKYFWHMKNIFLPLENYVFM